MSLRADFPNSELSILGMGHFHPENIIDNAFLESLDIGTDDAWITERVGIKTRRTVLSLDYVRQTRNANPLLSHESSSYTNAKAGALAAQMALDRAGLAPSEIGMVIAGGCSPEHSIPAEACTVAAELGISAVAFDLNSACSSFAAQLHFLRSMAPESLPDHILVVNTENTTRTVDYNDRNTAVLWGDASSAAVVSKKILSDLRVQFSTLHSDPTGWEKVIIPTGGHFDQNGSAVQAFAIRKTSETLKELREHTNSDRPYFIGHQANLTMLRSVCARMEIPTDRHLFNVDRFGNCGAAGAPSVLSENWDRFLAGDEILLVVVGSGLTWGGLVLKKFEKP